MSVLLDASIPPLVGDDPGDRAPRDVVRQRIVPRRLVRGATAAIGLIAFWYGATGMLLALERSGTTRLLALGIAVLAAAAGLVCTLGARRSDGARAGARAVLGGALLWTCVSTAFYSGWVVGPARANTLPVLDAAARAPSMARALDALAATAYSSALAAALLLLAVWASRPSRAGAPTHRAVAARFAPATFATLWAAHELAKLNVFVGVASPGAAYLPAYLAHLRQFFGPAHNSPLLAASVIALATTAVLVGTRARHVVGDPARRTGLALLAGIVALAALEHAMLGVRTPPGWWDAFVAWREAPVRALDSTDPAAARGPSLRAPP